MKTMDTLKTKVASPAILTCLVVALSAVGAGIKMPNHNETVVRDRS